MEVVAPPSYKLSGYARGSVLGSIGGGKTTTLCNDIISQAVHYNCNIVFGRAEYADFRTTTEEELEKWLPEQFIQKWPKNTHEITLKKNPNAINAKPRWIGGKLYPGRMKPSKIFLRGLAVPEKLKSYTTGGIGIDEASGVPFESFLMLYGRNREPSMHYTEYIFDMATNPCGGWVRDYIKMPERRPECPHKPDPYKLIKNGPCSVCQAKCKAGVGCSFIPSRISDNAFLPDNYEDVLRSLYPEEYARMMLEGDWDAIAGQVFSEFSTILSLYVDPIQIPIDWTRYFCMDPHTRTPTHCLWVAVSPLGMIYVYRELVISSTVKDIADTIKKLEHGEHIFCRLIDTSANSDDHLTGLNIRDEFAKNGLSCHPVKKGNMLGYYRAKEYLRENRIAVFRNLPVFQDQMKGLIWEDFGNKMTAARKEMPQMWVKKNDHLWDCLKYILIVGPKYVPVSQITFVQREIMNAIGDLSEGLYN